MPVGRTARCALSLRATRRQVEPGPARSRSQGGEAVGPGGRVVEEVALLVGAEGSGHALERVPDLDIAEARLVDGEVRLEQAARRAEGVDREGDLVAPYGGDLLGGRFDLPLVPPLARQRSDQRP